MGELQLQPQQIAMKGSLNKNGFYLWGLVDGMAEVNNYTHPQDNLTHMPFFRTDQDSRQANTTRNKRNMFHMLPMMMSTENSSDNLHRLHLLSHLTK